MALKDLGLRLFSPLVADFAPEEKASKTGPLIAFHMPGQPVWTPRNYADLAREGYAKNAVVYRCVRMIAEAAGSVHLDAFDGGEALDDHPLVSLLARPNATQCGPDLLESWYGFLLVSGNAFMEAVSVSDAVRELHVLRPDRVIVVYDVRGRKLVGITEFVFASYQLCQDGAEEAKETLGLLLRPMCYLRWMKKVPGSGM